MLKKRTGILFVISAPSGTGKSTVAERVLAAVPDLAFSVSYTTRPPRVAEQEGREYHFVSRERFESLVAEGAFLEWAPVYGHLYGTAKDELRRILAGGDDLLLDIDVQGARQARRVGEIALQVVSIMLMPPDYGALTTRLSERGSETREMLAKRLDQARGEAEQYSDFDYMVINDDVERAVVEIAAIVRAERRRSSRCLEEAGRILASFPA